MYEPGALRQRSREICRKVAFVAFCLVLYPTNLSLAAHRCQVACESLCKASNMSLIILAGIRVELCCFPCE